MVTFNAVGNTDDAQSQVGIFRSVAEKCTPKNSGNLQSFRARLGVTAMAGENLEVATLLR